MVPLRGPGPPIAQWTEGFACHLSRRRLWRSGGSVSEAFLKKGLQLREELFRLRGTDLVSILLNYQTPGRLQVASLSSTRATPLKRHGSREGSPVAVSRARSSSSLTPEIAVMNVHNRGALAESWLPPSGITVSAIGWGLPYQASVVESRRRSCSK